MIFGNYLKSWRDRYRLTQDELVIELYEFSEVFSGLNIGTLSRWERCSSQPQIEKKIEIIRLFQTKSNHILSCFEGVDKHDIESELCKIGVKNIVGTSKDHILNFPTKAFKVDDILIKHIRNTTDIDDVLKMPYAVIENLTDNAYNLSFENIKEWALHPSNLFLLSEYKNQFAGILFALRLKPDIFQKIINFELELRDITKNDFANFDEMGCNMPISFFAYNEKSSTLLIVRYYAHLIANQDVILELGALPVLDSARKIVEKMNMKEYKKKIVPKGVLTSYHASLSEALINESVLKMIFQKQEY